MKKIVVAEGMRPDLVSKQFDLDRYVRRDTCLAFRYEKEFESQVLKEIRAKGIPIIGTPRFDKIDQTVIMDRFGIKHPESFYDVKDYSCIKDIDTLNSYCDLDEFVVKPILGARGIGVKKITRKEFKECLYNREKVDEVFKEENEYLVTQNQDAPTYFIKDNIECMLIQEPINVVKEYRILYFKPGFPIGYERVKNLGQFCGNLSHGSTSRILSSTEVADVFRPLMDQFDGLMDEYKYPWLSIDVYVDDKGNTGVFEFQMEFAYEGFNHVEVRDLMVDSLNYFIK